MEDRMVLTRQGMRLRTGVMLLGVIVLLGWVSIAHGHGGKKHAESFTALQALQKATDLYDKLIIKDKLDEAWETDLNAVEISMRDSAGGSEYRVGFHRQSGSPEAVYIFFSSDGKYSGSNFDGNW